MEEARSGQEYPSLSTGKNKSLETPQQQVPNMSTRELAALFRVEPATIRRAYCVNGHYLTLKPLKLPNGRLLWPKAAIQQVLGGCNDNPRS